MRRYARFAAGRRSSLWVRDRGAPERHFEAMLPPRAVNPTHWASHHSPGPLGGLGYRRNESGGVAAWSWGNRVGRGLLPGDRPPVHLVASGGGTHSGALAGASMETGSPRSESWIETDHEEPWRSHGSSTHTSSLVAVPSTPCRSLPTSSASSGVVARRWRVGKPSTSSFPTTSKLPAELSVSKRVRGSKPNGPVSPSP